MLSCCFSAAYCDGQPQKVYWDIELFRALRALAPELEHARLANLTAAGQEAWEEGEMRVPESSATTLVGDFTGDGREDRAVLFEAGEREEKHFYLLVATHQGNGWKRLLLWRLVDRVGSLVWDAEGGALCVETNLTWRRTKPAEMLAGPVGIERMSPGYVIVEVLVRAWRWDPKANAFVELKPYWLDRK